MKLLSVIHGPVFGGGHMQMIRLREPLEARGFETIALVPDEPGSAADRLREARIDLCQMPLHRLRATPDPRVQVPFAAALRREIAAIRNLIRERSIDLVQAHGDTNPHAAIAAHLEGKAVVWQLYDTRTPVPLRRVTMPLVTRLADTITTWGRELAVAHPGAISLGDRCIPVFPPVDAERFAAAAARRDEARRELGVPSGAVALGNVGNRNPSKGHEWLVRAAALVRESEPATVVRILGAESPPHARYEEDFLREARALGLGTPEALRVLDPRDRVPELLPALDVFVLSSVPRSEGMPTVILEAMAMGLPVVATDVGAVAEIVEHGATGLVVAPEQPRALADAILELVRDPALRRRMGDEGRRRALGRYGLEPLADIHAGAYELALEHRAGRKPRG